MKKRISIFIALCFVIMIAFSACAANERNKSNTNPARDNTAGTNTTDGWDGGTTNGTNRGNNTTGG
ncbi:MAG: hypothetical protein EWM47_07635, partial [Anaerolineaceae bacterium]